MQHATPASPSTLGADLRTLRKARRLTLAALARRLGRSVGWLSQVERDLSEPSITDLRHIGEALHETAQREHLGLVSLLAWLRERAASAADLAGLIRLAQGRIEEQFGIAMEPEVTLVGEGFE